MKRPLEGKWALILGASSGFGEATALELARRGMHVFGVHLDRKSTLANVERIQGEIRGMGRDCRFFNMNAADSERREAAVEQMGGVMENTDQHSIRVLLHSLAFGSLGRFFPGDGSRAINKDQINMTLDVMANSLVYWVQSLLQHGLLQRGARIFAMTSEGGRRVWHSYGPVSAAKAALESHIRQIALELAPLGITANAIQAGVTDTPALRKIPGHEEMAVSARRKNPSGRLTEPEDVARAIALLSHSDSQWITGTVVRVDGGEELTG